MSIPYVDYGGTQTLQPPYVAQNIRFYAFLVPADIDALQRVLDERLNKPSHGAVQFEPAGPFVLFAFNTLGKMFSMNPPDRDKGWFAEQECAIWMRVVDRKSERSMWFLPYIFVDNSYALALGREVYGFPKAFGWLQIPDDPRQAKEVSLETLVLPVFSPDTAGVKKRLISARQISESREPLKMLTSVIEFSEECAGLLARQDNFVQLAELVVNSLQDLVQRAAPLVFLKQFPCADAPGEACHRSIVTMTANWTDVYGMCVLPGEWQLEILPAASHPIASDLGLSGNSLQSALGLWVNFDMNVNLGEVLWVASPNEMKREKIAILGGGVGAMSTALELTSSTDWKSRYDITVYQTGWRLGGKGASGRGENGRIEEHGLHIWLGFYENAFRIMQQVYEENKVNRPDGAPLREWTDAFKSHAFVGIMDRVGIGTEAHWASWPIHLPPAHGVPGDGLPLTMWEAFGRLLGWIKEIYVESQFHKRGGHPIGFHHSLSILKTSFGHLLPKIEFLADLTMVGQLEFVLKVVEGLGRNSYMHSLTAHIDLGTILDHFRQSIRDLIHTDLESGDVASRRLFQVVDLGLSISIGLLKGGYLTNPAMLSTLEDDLQTWLKNQGADPLSYSVHKSAIVRSLYDLVFAYENGDTDKPSFEAGPALRSILLIVGAYKGSLFWKMQAGMGDVVFGPIYQVLKDRGVKFEFFHRVDHLDLSADGKSVDAVRLSVQATMKDAAKEYNPLLAYESLPSWPATPCYQQLVEGDQLKACGANLESFWTTWKNPSEKTLSVGKHFDKLVLGISLGALPYLFDADAKLTPRFRSMMREVATVRTQAIQLWVNKPLEQLGWSLGSIVIDAFAEPINTWAVMEQLLSRESWPDDAVNGIHYFCGQMIGGIASKEDTEAPAKALAELKATYETFQRDFLPILWPDMNAPDFKIVSHYLRANIDPSERYVLSVAHSSKFRLRADEAGIANLVLAGDWTDNGFNAGCVEAAVMSGIQAANALKGRPLNEGIDGPLVSELQSKAAATS